MCCGVLQRVAAFFSVLQCVALCCSALQYVADMNMAHDSLSLCHSNDSLNLLFQVDLLRDSLSS